MPVSSRAERLTAVPAVDPYRHLGSEFVRNNVRTMNSKAVKDPKGRLSQKFFDLSHAGCLMSHAPSSIEADQAGFQSPNRRLCFAVVSAKQFHHSGNRRAQHFVFWIRGDPGMGRSVMTRSTIFGLAVLLLLGLFSTAALARHGGGHMGSGHWGGGHWAGGSHWSGHSHFAFNGARFHHHRRFIVGFAGYDYGCWRLRPTPWGWRRVWVCGYPYYGFF